MAVHLNVLSLSMEDWVLNEVNTTHVVAIEENWILDGNTQILQDYLEPNGFTCSDDGAPLFGFGAQQCDCQLLFAALGDGSNLEGEDEP